MNKVYGFSGNQQTGIFHNNNKPKFIFNNEDNNDDKIHNNNNNMPQTPTDKKNNSSSSNNNDYYYNPRGGQFSTAFTNRNIDSNNHSNRASGILSSLPESRLQEQKIKMNTLSESYINERKENISPFSLRMSAEFQKNSSNNKNNSMKNLDNSPFKRYLNSQSQNNINHHHYQQ